MFVGRLYDLTDSALTEVWSLSLEDTEDRRLALEEALDERWDSEPTVVCCPGNGLVLPTGVAGFGTNCAPGWPKFGIC